VRAVIALKSPNASARCEPVKLGGLLQASITSQHSPYVAPSLHGVSQPR